MLIVVLASYQLDAQSRNEIDAAMLKVKRYLLLSPRLVDSDDTQWLPNSGKIGVGYDLVKGSPVCYTGQCQMEGFRQPVFKLDMTKRAEGSCTNKFIPKNVNLDCLSSTQITANTESITTLDQLMENTKRNIDFSLSMEGFGNSFSYSHSHETRSMIDTIIQSNSTVYFTRATITWVRLSAFTPLLELSDQFRYVIDNMPCCNQSHELDQYIQEFIIEFFGIMYVKDLLLGGIAQQNIIVSEENQKNLRMNGFTTAHQAELKIAAASIFSASTKLSMTEQIDQTRLNTFKKFSQQNSIITLGGGVSMQSIEEWSKTVSSNPTIIKFGIAPIIDLLTARRFPQDVKITSKRELIRRVLEIYLTNQLFCYNNCSQHGLCVATKYFGFGQCLCDRAWSGIDCSIAVGSGKVHTLISTQPIGLKLEGILGYVYGTKQPDACRLYRYWKSGQHFYTVDPCEIGVAKPGSIGSHGFKSEGMVAYVLTTFKCETIACQ
ncbi:unnamed protein product [Rotaria socialis]|uniref:MACPF domain-containing protein n=1 Tax=Rotaria socialis TaxID=392032 RepID=A0A821WNQ8_9BILA|nr:unnamed protein product [Rotaria socialis]